MHMVMIGTNWNCGTAETERNDDVDPGRRHNVIVMHDAQQRRQHRAGDDAEQHRDVGDETGEPADQAEYHQQHEQRDAQALKLAVIVVWESAAPPSTTLVTVGRPPPAQLMPTRINEMPITRIIVPVTTGGNSGNNPPHEGRDHDRKNAGGNHRAVNSE